ncbi:MAG: transcription antitermination factor NusB [Alteromonadaceae bacterium]|nr:MAG: transcription antitermination factor NusB [Alteromonadaceae bacterium]
MKVSAAKRSRARHYAMQAIYQWQMTANQVNVIEAEYRTDNDMSKVDVDYFHELFHGVTAKKSELDSCFSPYLKDLSIDRLDPITLALLRLSCFEFSQRADVPYRVVINESVNLAKKFGAADSHKFINGVLDKVALDLRATEVAEHRAARRS